MGQYQGKAPKGTDEDLAGEHKVESVAGSESEPTAIPGTADTEVQPQPPVFGSPLDSEFLFLKLLEWGCGE